jgi:hypothetical protein
MRPNYDIWKKRVIDVLIAVNNWALFGQLIDIYGPPKALKAHTALIAPSDDLLAHVFPRLRLTVSHVNNLAIMFPFGAVGAICRKHTDIIDINWIRWGPLDWPIDRYKRSLFVRYCKNGRKIYWYDHIYAMGSIVLGRLC